MSGKAGRLRVAVVFGGRSAEHAISCVSAGSVIGALDPERYEVVPVGIAADGRWVLADGDQRMAITDGSLPEVSGGTAVSLVGDPEGRGFAVLEPGAAVGRALTEVDVVFPVLHGTFGEDGTIQGLLEMAGLPYVGSGVFASAASMDKEFTKKLLAAAGLPQGDHVVLRDADGAVCADPAVLTEAERDRLGLPVFVKPARAGSSIGITKVTDWAQFPAAVADAAAVDPKVIVEAAVPGPRDRVRGAGLAGERAARVQPARGDPPAAGHRLVRLLRQVPRRRRRLRRAGRPDARADGGGAGRGPPRLPGPGLPRPGAGRLLPRHGTRRLGPAGDQRGQHDARLHADLDVPADVGGLRRELPRAGRPAGRRRPDAAARGRLGERRAPRRRAGSSCSFPLPSPSAGAPARSTAGRRPRP